MKLTFELIPMSDIRPETRELAVSWAEANKYDWIGDKHKLASDIQNYSDWYNSLLQAKIDRYEAALREIAERCDDTPIGIVAYNALKNE